MSRWQWTENDRLFAARIARLPKPHEQGFKAALAEAFRLDEHGRDAHDGGPPELALIHIPDFNFAELGEMVERAARATAALKVDLEKTRAGMLAVPKDDDKSN